jgi:tetratricopeptide (TPR) repeat protein
LPITAFRGPLNQNIIIVERYLMNYRFGLAALLVLGELGGPGVLRAQVRPEGSLERIFPPAWFTAFRDAAYGQTMTAEELAFLGQEVEERAVRNLSGGERYLILSRCEGLLGRAYLYEERRAGAEQHLEQGLDYAEQALTQEPSAEAYRLLAEHTGQLCIIRSLSYLAVNGPKMERYAKRALALEPRNAAARYLLAARYIYAPSPFASLQRGIPLLEGLAMEGGLDREERFNVYTALIFAYTSLNKRGEARLWLERALALYPTNRWATELYATGKWQTLVGRRVK